MDIIWDDHSITDAQEPNKQKRSMHGTIVLQAQLYLRTQPIDLEIQLASGPVPNKYQDLPVLLVLYCLSTETALLIA